MVSTRRNILFIEWFLDNSAYLFPIYREPRLSLEGLLHFLMKRISGLDYNNLMTMPREKINSFFADEYEIYQKELQESSKQQ